MPQIATLAALAATTSLASLRPNGARMSAPRAKATDPAGIAAEIAEAFETFKATNEQQLNARFKDVVTEDKIEAINASLTALQGSLDDQARTIAAANLGGARVDPLADAEYSEAFEKFVRSPEDPEAKAALRAMQRTGPRAAMSEGSAVDGGYTAPVEWDRTILGRLKLISPIRAEATVQTTTKRGFVKLLADRAVGSGWVGETAARPATSTPQFAPLTVGMGEIYANAGATQDLLDDSEINLQDWLTGEIDIEFSRQEGIAFLSGDGNNKPYGLLTYVTGGANAALHPWGAILTTASGAANNTTSDAVVDLQMSLPAIYTSNAKFFANRLSFGKLRKLKDGQGNYIWQPSFQAGVPSTLGGYPLIDTPDMPAMTTGNAAVLFGDMREAYLVIDRMGTRVLIDPYTNKPYVQFYCTKRVGGIVQNPDAMKALVIA